MFIAMYRFKVLPGMEKTFESAWLERTKGIYLRLGSLGSRLHRESDGGYIAYAQWPSRQIWLEADSESLDEKYMIARDNVKRCLSADETIFEMNVISDYLQIRPFE